MIGIDTNILVYAHREDSEWYLAADRCLTQLAESGQPWAIPWPCLHEFIAIVTHPRIYDPSTPLAISIEQINCWLEAPTLVLLSESVNYWKILPKLLEQGRIVGPKVHDARTAALCQQHGVTELWTADRDFKSFQPIITLNPLVSTI
jgi:hypothetical protein